MIYIYTSFDHVIAMPISFVGGILLPTMEYQYVFIVTAFIAAIILLLSLKIKLD